MASEHTWEAEWQHRLDEAFGHLERVIGAHVATVQGLPPHLAALEGLTEEEAIAGDVIERYARHHAHTGRPLRPLPVLIQDQPSWHAPYVDAWRKAELDGHPDDALFVVRRASGGHALGAWHPSGQWIYAKYVDESDVNAPDYYGFTLDTARATRVTEQEVTREWSPLNPASFVRQALWDHPDENGLASIAETLQVPRADLDLWCEHATWEPVPLALCWQYLADFNGFVGYRAEWSEHLSDALVFSVKERRDNNPDAQLAAGLGAFIRVQTDEQGQPQLTL